MANTKTEKKAKQTETPSVTHMASVPPSALNAGANALEKLAHNVYHGNVHADITKAYAADIKANEGKKKPEYPAMRELLPAFARKQKDQFTMLVKLLGHDASEIQSAYDARRATQTRVSQIRLSGLLDSVQPKTVKAAKTGANTEKNASPFETAISMAGTLAKFIAKHKFNDDERKLIMDKLAAK